MEELEVFVTKSGGVGIFKFSYQKWRNWKFRERESLSEGAEIESLSEGQERMASLNRKSK